MFLWFTCTRILTTSMETALTHTSAFTTWSIHQTLLSPTKWKFKFWEDPGAIGTSLDLFRQNLVFSRFNGKGRAIFRSDTVKLVHEVVNFFPTAFSLTSIAYIFSTRTSLSMQQQISNLRKQERYPSPMYPLLQTHALSPFLLSPHLAFLWHFRPTDILLKEDTPRVFRHK